MALCVVRMDDLQVLGRASDTFGRVAMLELSAAGSLIGAVGCLYAPDKWSFIAAR